MDVRRRVPVGGLAVTPLMLLCCVNTWAGGWDDAQRVRPLLRRQGLLRNRCARPVAALDPGASAARVGRCGQARACPAVHGVLPGSARAAAVRLLVLGLGAPR